MLCIRNCSVTIIQHGFGKEEWKQRHLIIIRISDSTDCVVKKKQRKKKEVSSPPDELFGLPQVVPQPAAQVSIIHLGVVVDRALVGVFVVVGDRRDGNVLGELCTSTNR